MAAHLEKKISGDTVFEGKVFTVTVDKVALENGHTSLREVVHHSGGAAIVALNEKNEVALVRQFRYALGRELIEIPAGKIEPGEPPMETAIRELREEIGCATNSIRAFGSIIPTCGYCSETIYLFCATNLQFLGQRLDNDEFLDVFWLPLEEAAALALQGEITDGKTVAGLLRAKELLASGRL